MGDYRLSLIQRNEVFQDAKVLGLDAASFDWSEAKDNQQNRVHQIDHQPTGAYLRIGHFVAMSTSGYTLAHHWPRTAGLSARANHTRWPEVREQIGMWLVAVKAESDAPDLWALARQERAWLTAPATQADNSPFTPTEREIIARHLKTIEEFTIKSYAADKQQAEFVRQEIRYLTDAADRVGRFDWKNLAASTFITIVLTLTLEPEKANRLFALATQLLGPLVAGVAKLLS